MSEHDEYYPWFMKSNNSIKREGKKTNQDKKIQDKKIQDKKPKNEIKKSTIHGKQQFNS